MKLVIAALLSIALAAPALAAPQENWEAKAKAAQAVIDGKAPASPSVRKDVESLRKAGCTKVVVYQDADCPPTLFVCKPQWLKDGKLRPEVLETHHPAEVAFDEKGRVSGFTLPFLLPEIIRGKR